MLRLKKCRRTTTPILQFWLIELAFITIFILWKLRNLLLNIVLVILMLDLMNKIEILMIKQ